MEDEEYTKEEYEEALKKLNSLKNCDYVFYHGCEYWKPNRKFESFKKTAEDLGITEEQFDDLKETMESVWMFCDTIFFQDNAEEDDMHILDYCFHGERMEWKEGDEYWLVLNVPCNRLEIRKAEEGKWTPLERYFINGDLELRFKLGYMGYNDNFDETPRFVHGFSVNSFPDRIELSIFSPYDEYDDDINIGMIFQYYLKYSSFVKENEAYKKELKDLFFSKFLNEDIRDALEIVKSNQSILSGWRHYGLYDENLKENPDDYYETFLKYSHQLKFYQMRNRTKFKNKEK